MVKTPQLHCGIIGSIPVGVKFRNLFFIFFSGFTQGISQRKLKRRKVEKSLNLPGALALRGRNLDMNMVNIDTLSANVEIINKIRN
jgi:hypothetical protein